VSVGPARGRAARWGLACVSLLAALLLAEGALSLLGQRTLSALWRPSQAAPRGWAAPTEADRWRAAAQNAGPWRVHEDPLVGYCLRPQAELEIFGAVVHSDALGLRRRPGSAAAPGALRVAVLGDSVAFGWGVADDETLAHRLEQELAARALPGARPVECLNVSMPGWNHRNPVAFLLDHYDQLLPDIVLYMPIDNDLANTYGVTEAGHRREAPDIATGDPWLCVSTDQNYYAVLDLGLRLAQQGSVTSAQVRQLGPRVLDADLSAESARRFDENAASILQLQQELGRRGGRLLVLQYAEQPYVWHLLARLARAPSPPPVLPLLAQVSPEFTLPSNPHPNAATLAVFAGWCADELQRLGWVQGLSADGRPAAPQAYLEQRAPRLAASAWEEQARRARQSALDELQPLLDTSSGRGMAQLYGGLSAGATAGRVLLLLLAAPEGPAELQLAVSALPERPDLYPLTLQVECDGAPVGTLVVQAEGRAQGRWRVDPAGRPACEVRVTAPRAVVSSYQDRLLMSAYRVHEVALQRAP